MKKVIFYFLLLIGSVCTFTACDNDDDDDNGNDGNSAAGSVMFGNDNFRFFVGWYDYEPSNDSGYIDLIFDLLTEDKAASLNLDDLDPYDDDVREELDKDLTELNFSLIYEDPTISLPKSGTYMVDLDEDSYKDMTISQGYFGDYDIVSGSCKISISGNIYTIEIDFVCENNKSLKGTYKGVLRDYDE